MGDTLSTHLIAPSASALPKAFSAPDFWEVILTNILPGSDVSALSPTPMPSFSFLFDEKDEQPLEVARPEEPTAEERLRELG